MVNQLEIKAWLGVAVKEEHYIILCLHIHPVMNSTSNSSLLYLTGRLSNEISRLKEWWLSLPSDT